MYTRKKYFVLIYVIVLILGFGSFQLAESQEQYPVKPIQLIVPWPPGGPTDTDARIWAEFAQKVLGQPIIVLNKPGAGSVIGTSLAATAKPDGYTLLQGTAGSNLIGPLAQKIDYGFDSFLYIVRFVQNPNGLCVHAESRWKTLADFIQDAKKNPGKLIMSSIGSAGWNTLAPANWAEQAGIKLKWVHYQGGAPSMMAVLGKHADIIFQYPQVILPHVKAGKLRLLAVGETFKEYPEVPTFKQLGYTGNYSGWSGILAPKGTPDFIIKKLGDITENKLMKNPEFIKAIINAGETPFFEGPKEFQAFANQQYEEIGAIIDKLGLRAK